MDKRELSARLWNSSVGLLFALLFLGAAVYSYRLFGAADIANLPLRFDPSGYNQLVTDLSQATLSADYRLELPEEVRELLHAQPGDSLAFYELDGEVVLIRTKSPRELRGTLAGVAGLDSLDGLRDRTDPA